MYSEGAQIYDTPNQVIKNDMIDYNGTWFETMNTLKLKENGLGVFEPRCQLLVSSLHVNLL